MNWIVKHPGSYISWYTLCQNRIGFCLLSLAFILFSHHANAIGFGKSKEPSWVKEQIADTDHVFYGIGSGKNPQEAKQVALEDIAGKLLTKVQSSKTSRVLAKNNDVSEEFSSDIQTSVENMGLSGYAVDVSEKKGKTHWVRLSLDKATLYTSTKAQLDPIMLELDAIFSNLTKKSALELKLNTDDITNSIEDAKRKLFLMSSAKTSYNAVPVQQKLSNYQSALQSKVDNLVLYVKASGQMTELAAKIAHELNQEDWVASTQKPAQEPVTILLSGKFKDGEQFGAHFSAATLSIKVIDEAKNVIDEQQFNIHGTSRSSHANARQIAANRFVEDLKLDGVASKLGLEE